MRLPKGAHEIELAKKLVRPILFLIVTVMLMVVVNTYLYFKIENTFIQMALVAFTIYTVLSVPYLYFTSLNKILKGVREQS